MCAPVQYAVEYAEEPKKCNTVGNKVKSDYITLQKFIFLLFYTLNLVSIKFLYISYVLKLTNLLDIKLKV